MNGTKLAHYEITSHLGSGGMGEVYQATDSKLGRSVAIKFLPEVFTHDAERAARFDREARVLASLNHSNIAAIFGLEESGDRKFLVMELVGGETLAERIKRGPIPVDEALQIAMQICEALEAAHEKGIIHRDLKPANVKITPEGNVKVLDFGLAKAFENEPANAALSNSPTLSMAATNAGMILGTAAYMSPEQAKGRIVDKRTDIWALGCVMYEMLTGKQTFSGESVTDILGAVLHKEPDWSAFPEDVPPGIRALLRRCLQKDANKRLRGAADVAIALEDAFTVPASPPFMPVTAKSSGSVWKRRVAFSVVGLLACAITAAAVWNLRAPAPQLVSRLTISLPPGQRVAGLNQPAIAISPNGRNLVYVAVQDNPSSGSKGAITDQVRTAASVSAGTQQQLYFRPLDSLESKPIAGTEGAVGPFFSPDGQWIGFFADGKLKKVSVNGGGAQTLAIAPNPGGASWSSQGTLALQGVTTTAGGLQQISPDGSSPQPITKAKEREFSHRWPEFLPGGTALLFAVSPSQVSWTNAQIAVQPMGTGEHKDLPQGGTQPRYAASGHLLYAQSGMLMAAPFDARHLALSGGPVSVIEDVMQSAATGAAQYSISSTGTLVYLAGGLAGSQSRLVWVSRKGEEQPLPAASRNYQFPRVSPDGRRVAASISEEDTQVWVYDVSRETLTKLTFEGNLNQIPTWSFDGMRIVFQSNRAGLSSLFWQAVDGSDEPERLTTTDPTPGPSSLSPDGQLLAFIQNTPETGRDIWVLNLKDHKAQPILKTPNEESAPKFSPDGRWLAYSSDESGRREIYVQSYPDRGGKRLISTDGGQEPVWNPKGGELFYRIGNKMMAVEVDTQSGFSAGKPRMLFEGPYLPSVASFPYYDVSPDGQRFLMLKPVESQVSAPTQINVVLNWFEELKQKAPTGK